MAHNVLIVLDGDYWFGNPANLTQPPPPGLRADFSYIALVQALESEGMNVTKAHRNDGATKEHPVATGNFETFPIDTTADITSFNFATSVNLLDFDAIWLIGFAGRNVGGFSGFFPLSNAELNAIAQYMDAGGGIFGTGDHDSIGADMCGRIPRLRLMRAWYGSGDPASPFAPLPAELANFHPTNVTRADTCHKKVAGETPAFDYPAFDGTEYVWFENQSDRFPQPIVPNTTPTHPILRKNGSDIVVYPDHMHEGQTLDGLADSFYANASPFGDTTLDEFRTVAGSQKRPKAIAIGQGLAQGSRRATGGANPSLVGEVATPKTVKTLTVYDGREAGVGRIVSGSTFHHYVDINLTGDSAVTTTTVPSASARVGSDAEKLHGFNDNSDVFADIKQVFVNITNWIARPKPAIQLILEKSTYSQDEAPSGAEFPGAVLVIVDGLTPSQFPGGPPVLGAIAGPAPSWVPDVTVTGESMAVIPTSVSSDDPAMPERLQRFTFRYKVQFNANAFEAADPDVRNLPIDVSLTSTAVSGSLTDAAFLQLVKSANPYMLDLEEGNETTWLSSDVKVFHLVEGSSLPGIGGGSLALGADRAAALSFIRNLADNINEAEFSSLSGVQSESGLSIFPRTTSSDRAVYNFALARVRKNPVTAANDVRLFFRIFTTQTTAALTYRESSPGVPIEGYMQTADATPIALPGQAGGDWISFPFFAAERAATPAAQGDLGTAKDIGASDQFTYYGALLDNNLDDEYRGLIPGAPTQPTIRSLLNGEHQCLVAQIEFSGTPIPDGATPWTSDKLAQRNIAMVSVANPGLDASRAAFHTFEIEATPHPVSPALWPDELLLDWSLRTPEGTMLRIHIPSWNARKVVELADRFYPRHEIEAVDDHTIEMPGGGTRYVPIPQCLARQVGVISAEFPLGIKKGQRFDVSVRQITNRHRGPRIPEAKLEMVTLEEAGRLIAALPARVRDNTNTMGKGEFDLGGNRTLLTDMRVLDMADDRALIIENPEPAAVAAAVADTRHWRESIGAFQLGIPVSTKREMRLDQMRLLSVMRWRLAHMPRNSRWRKTMQYYVSLLSDKVQALGGNPFEVPATPDGAIPQLPWVGTDSDGDGAPDGPGGVGSGSLEEIIRKLAYPWGCLLLVMLLLILLWLLLQ
jgi:hypothetical protein